MHQVFAVVNEITSFYISFLKYKTRKIIVHILSCIANVKYDAYEVLTKCQLSHNKICRIDKWLNNKVNKQEILKMLLPIIIIHFSSEKLNKISSLRCKHQNRFDRFLWISPTSSNHQVGRPFSLGRMCCEQRQGEPLLLTIFSRITISLGRQRTYLSSDLFIAQENKNNMLGKS